MHNRVYGNKVLLIKPLIPEGLDWMTVAAMLGTKETKTEANAYVEGLDTTDTVKGVLLQNIIDSGKTIWSK